MGKQHALFPEAPSQSSALSAYIKGVRLRRSEDAVLWLLAMWYAGQGPRERVQRRVLIAAGEDNLSVHVAQSVAGWFSGPRRHDIREAIRQTALIARTPNWYATPAGRTYIRTWHSAVAAPDAYVPERPLAALKAALYEADLHRAIQCFSTFYADKNSNRRELARVLVRAALESGGTDAIAFAELFETNLGPLWTDGNFSGQALYRVLRPLPSTELHGLEVTDDEVDALLTDASLRLLSADLTVPAWAADGIHAPGEDRRFSGALPDMKRACDAYEHFGRLHPGDDWSSLDDQL